ncbi:protein NRT1/ PTR FAMILY 5.14-like isoform X2 [Vigna unguiculata]|uniref:protein NRT1/ PTR FAMILY 5.14-like isoform X2 n=1 Tax=Vigna unguiculata TaxID=3917 RepID=UPI00101615FF|nr:protein NRT1/ PTR FAMILY 5.14-like isoform X2 [Vigna unguiculata]
MAQLENGSEINFSFAGMKNLVNRLPSPFNLKTIPVIALIACYTVMELLVVSTLVDYLSDSGKVKDLRITAALNNLQDSLSSLLFIFVSLISEAYTGPFNMITVCSAASIQGLMLLWISASSAFRAVYAAMLFLALGKSGQKLLENFLEHQEEATLIEATKKCEIEYGSTIKKNEELLFFVGFLAIVFTSFFIESYEELFRYLAVSMGGGYLLFLFGSTKYRHEKVAVESNLGRIFRICKATCGRKKSDFPASIIQQQDSRHLEVSPDTQEGDGRVCTVKDVRDVKSLVPMFRLCFAFFAYSLLVATGNTYFVAQASTMLTTKGFDISKLFLIKTGVGKVSQFICFLIMACLRCMRTTDFTSKRFAVGTSIIRIVFGMFCAVICCLVARKVEFQRLSLPVMIDENNGERIRPVRITALVPQFILLGMTEALVEGGLESLFLAHVAKSMQSFVDSYSELVHSIGKLFLIPLVLTFGGSWFKESIDTTHLDRFYLMLGILNAAFLLVFIYSSFKYSYKGICYEDDDDHQPDTEAFNEQDVEKHSEDEVEANVEENDQDQVGANVEENKVQVEAIVEELV